MECVRPGWQGQPGDEPFDGLEDCWVSEFQGNLLLLLVLARDESLGKEGSLCCNGEEDQSTAALLPGASAGTTVRWGGIGKIGYNT